MTSEALAGRISHIPFLLRNAKSRRGGTLRDICLESAHVSGYSHPKYSIFRHINQVQKTLKTVDNLGIYAQNKTKPISLPPPTASVLSLTGSDRYILDTLSR